MDCHPSITSICLSGILSNLKLSTSFGSPEMRPKLKLSCFHIASRLVVRFLLPLLWYCSLCFLSPPTLPSNPKMHYVSSSSNPLLVKLPKSRLTAHLNSFIPRFVCLCNHLPEVTLSHSSLQSFKQAAHSHLMSSTILNHDLYCPH